MKPRIRLTGFHDAAKVESIFASFLVDVAYVNDIGPDDIDIIGDDCIDLSDPKVYAWAASLIEDVLRGHGIVDIAMELISEARKPFDAAGMPCRSPIMVARRREESHALCDHRVADQNPDIRLRLHRH